MYRNALKRQQNAQSYIEEDTNCHNSNQDANSVAFKKSNKPFISYNFKKKTPSLTNVFILSAYLKRSTYL